MTQVPENHNKNLSTYRWFVALLLKVIGLVLLFFSISYWAKLVGISDAAIGFDTLPTYWKVAGAALVVLMPVAALGLWGNNKWGIVVWFLVVAIEVVMYGFYTSLFGTSQGLLVFHGASVSAFVLAMVVILYLEQMEFRRSQAS